MNKKNIKPLLLSSLAALSLGSVSVAGTFALFTDQAETTISIGAAEVSVKNAMTIEGAYSLNGAEVGTAVAEGKKSATYINGGQATVKDVNGETTEVKIEKWTPGDGVKLRSAPVNGSNVTIKVRLKVVISGELAPALVMKVMKAGESDVVCAATGERTLVTDWAPVAPNVNPTAFDLEIAFPDHDNGEIKFGDENKDNQYQGKAATIKVSYEAVQGNADVSANLLERINTKLATNEVKEGKNANMYEAVNDLAGVVTLAQLKANDYVWGADEDLFYEAAGVTSGQEYKYFKVYEAANVPAKADQTFSIYADGSGWTSLELKGVGFDAGSVEGMTAVSYEGAASARENIIRTNGGTLTVNASLDTIRHYGEAQVITLTSVADHSYYEHGSVNLVDIQKGRLVITNDATAKVGSIYLTATENNYDGIVLATMNDAALPQVITREAVDLPAEGQKKLVAVVEQVNESGVADPAKTENIYLYAEQTAYEETKGYTGVSELGTLVLEAPNGTGSFTIKVKDGNTEKEVSVNYADLDESVTEEKTATIEEATTSAVNFAGGKGTQEKPYLIATAQHWNNFYQAVYDFNKEDKVPYFELANDINLTGFEITNYAVDGETNVYDHYMNFVLDGKNNKLLGIETLKGYCQLFPYLDNSTIKNITIDYKVVNSTRTTAMAYDAAGNCYFTNVTTTGEISTSANWATAFVAYSRGSNKIYYTNCTNMANIKGGFGNNAYIAVFGSHNGGGVHITFDNCKNYGGLLGGYVGFVGMGNDSVYTFVDENAVQNYGSMTGTKKAGYFKYDSTAASKTIGGVTCEVKKGSALATTSTTHTDSAPANFGDAIVLNAVSGAVMYEVEMSFSIQAYNYDDKSNANKWSGGFPRSMVLSYTDEDVENGKLTTAFRKGYVGEIKADEYFGYGDTTPSYDNGVFVPAEFDITKANIVLHQGDIYLVEDDGNYFYVLYSEQYHGWYALLTTNTAGEVTSNQVTVSFSVTAYNPDGSVLSFSSFSYASPVADAKAFFGALQKN